MTIIFAVKTSLVGPASGGRAFSYSKSHVPDVIRYIQKQEQHHEKQTFLEEYVAFLKAFEIEFDERYIFKELID